MQARGVAEMFGRVLDVVGVGRMDLLFMVLVVLDCGGRRKVNVR